MHHLLALLLTLLSFLPSTFSTPLALPGGEHRRLSPGPPPPGCAVTHPRAFALTAVPPSTPPSSRTAHTCASRSPLRLHLSQGVLRDARGWTGYIADNFQFQFDRPAQAGAIWTAGWSLCPDKGGMLALGGKREFWKCRSGSFSNLYDRKWAPQCVPVELRVVKVVDC